MVCSRLRRQPLCQGEVFTTAQAAKELGRRFVGCDVSQDSVNIGKHRIGQVTPPILLSA